MPELPDVEIERRRLQAQAMGRRIVEVHAPAAEILRETTPQALGRRLHGHQLEESHRHGKYLFARFGPKDWLVMHFGMTGRLAFFRESDSPPRYTDFVLGLDDGSNLAYVAPRKLGLVGLTDNPSAFAARQGLGPDVLALDRAGFAELAAGRRAGVKCWLMNQEVMAGIGNVYSDEALFRARIHPKTRVSDLDKEDLGRLLDALREVLSAAIDAEADPEHMPGDFLLPHREEDALCPRCGGPLHRIRACGRGAFLCRECQELGRPAP
jgi:formamidopyrimidine-DNA glycosylase